MAISLTPTNTTIYIYKVLSRLPFTAKFGVDKRRLHLSNLIVSGQLSREKALKVMEDIPYESLTALNQDTEYFLKKMS